MTIKTNDWNNSSVSESQKTDAGRFKKMYDDTTNQNSLVADLENQASVAGGYGAKAFEKQNDYFSVFTGTGKKENMNNGTISGTPTSLVMDLENHIENNKKSDDFTTKKDCATNADLGLKNTNLCLKNADAGKKDEENNFSFGIAASAPDNNNNNEMSDSEGFEFLLCGRHTKTITAVCIVLLMIITIISTRFQIPQLAMAGWGLFGVIVVVRAKHLKKKKEEEENEKKKENENGE